MSTIFVVDDDRAIREAMRDLLLANGYAVEIFADGPAFLEGFRPRPRRMPSGRCADAGHERRRADRATQCRRPPIARHRDHRQWRCADGRPGDEGGCRGFHREAGPAAKSCSPASSAPSIRRATAQSCPHRGRQPRRNVASLTTRQRQILDLVLAGHPSKNIAADLGISQRTVDNHRAAIMKKTGSKSMPALIRTALAAA